MLLLMCLSVMLLPQTLSSHQHLQCVTDAVCHVFKCDAVCHVFKCDAVFFQACVLGSSTLAPRGCLTWRGGSVRRRSGSTRSSAAGRATTRPSTTRAAAIRCECVTISRNMELISITRSLFILMTNHNFTTVPFVRSVWNWFYQWAVGGFPS